MKRADIDERSYVVVMSHNYLRDRNYLRSLLPSKAAYIGMLGPHARLQRLLGDLGTEGSTPTREQLERTYGPAGLDLGGEGAIEVERALHEGFFRDFGLSEEEVVKTPMAPTNRAYTSYLLAVCYGGGGFTSP